MVDVNRGKMRVEDWRIGEWRIRTSATSDDWDSNFTVGASSKGVLEADGSCLEIVRVVRKVEDELQEEEVA